MHSLYSRYHALTFTPHYSLHASSSLLSVCNHLKWDRGFTASCCFEKSINICNFEANQTLGMVSTHVLKKETSTKHRNLQLSSQVHSSSDASY
jgi:hypothetical protein